MCNAQDWPIDELSEKRREGFQIRPTVVPEHTDQNKKEERR
jgi:hypothetical protein